MNTCLIKRCLLLRNWLLLSLLFTGVTDTSAFGQTWRDSLELTFETPDGQSMPYRLFVPPGHDMPGAAYPLVLFLHRGEFRGTDNRQQVANHISGLIRATQGAEYPAFLLAPQTQESWWYESVRDVPTQIVESIEQQYQVDSSRIYITGTSMGGFATPDFVSRYPDRFAAAVPMSGGLIPTDQDHGANTPESFPVVELEAMSGVPFWVFHAEQDNLVPAEWSRKLVAELEKAGGEVHYTEVPRVTSHSGIWSSVYGDRDDELYPWLFDQSRSDFNLPGDLNRNHVLDVNDINVLTSEILIGDSRESRFDLNQDGEVTQEDRSYLITTLNNSYLGDSNLDGEFNSRDFVTVFEAGRYETGEAAGWAEGDWNGDFEFGSSDLVVAFADGGYEQGPRVNAVPEPSSAVLFVIGLLALVRRRN